MKKKKMRLTGRGQLISVGLRGDGTPSLPPSPPPRISARIIRGLACRPPLLFSSFSLFLPPPPFSSAFFEIRGQFGPNTGHRPLSAPVFTHERSVRFTGDDRFIDNPGQSFSFRDESIMFPPSRINSFPPGINNTGGLNSREGNWIRVFPLAGREMDVDVCGPFYQSHRDIQIEPRNLASL